MLHSHMQRYHDFLKKSDIFLVAGSAAVDARLGRFLVSLFRFFLDCGDALFGRCCCAIF